MTHPLALDGVTKVYAPPGRPAVTAVDGVSLAVEAGSMIALVGPSGCGKSTLLALMGCIDIPSSGTIRVEGRWTTGLDDAGLTSLRRDRIGTVFQSFDLLPSLTAWENVAVPLALQGLRPAAIERRVAEVLALVGMEKRAGAYPAELSGGEAQRVAVGRAVVHEPAVVLADEPTGNLDPSNAAAVIALLRALANRGHTIVVATHETVATAACDRVVRLRDGRLVA